MRNVMIDIETLGTKATSVVLSIGAVEFEFGKNELGQEFHRRVSIDSCLDHGLTLDGRTLEWWMDQSDEAKDVFRRPGDPLSEVLLDFQTAFNFEGEVWCNGAAFDVPILENAFHATKRVPPWKFCNVRDYRTVCNLVSRDAFKRLKVKPIIAHDALEDAKAQTLTLLAMMEHIRHG